MLTLDANSRTALTFLGGLLLFYFTYLFFNPVEFVDISGKTPFNHVIVIFIFGLWLTALFGRKQVDEYRALTFRERLNTLKAWNAAFARSPRWLSILTLSFFAFALINIILLKSVPTAEVIDGKYFYLLPGSGIKEIAQREFFVMKSDQLKIQSAIYIGMLGMSIGLLLARRN
jgi:hypothetical protein